MPIERNKRTKEEEKKARNKRRKKTEKQHSSCVEKMKPIHLLAKNTFEHSGATISSRGKCARDESHTARLVLKKLVPSTQCYRPSSGNVCRVSVQNNTYASWCRRRTPLNKKHVGGFAWSDLINDQILCLLWNTADYFSKGMLKYVNAFPSFWAATENTRNLSTN